MPGASSSWTDTSSTGGLWDYIKTKASDIWNIDKQIVSTIANVSPVQVVGPVLAIPTSMSKASQVVNSAGGFSNGITLSQSPTAWGDFFTTELAAASDTVANAPAPSSHVIDAPGAQSTTGILDLLKSWASKPASSSTDMPLWVKTAIIGAVVVGSAVVLKGVMK